jgi:outer membrane biosynthesis protein TonB
VGAYRPCPRRRAPRFGSRQSSAPASKYKLRENKRRKKNNKKKNKKNKKKMKRKKKKKEKKTMKKTTATTKATKVLARANERSERTQGRTSAGKSYENSDSRSLSSPPSDNFCVAGAYQVDSGTAVPGRAQAARKDRLVNTSGFKAGPRPRSRIPGRRRRRVRALSQSASR